MFCGRPLPPPDAEDRDALARHLTGVVPLTAAPKAARRAPPVRSAAAARSAPVVPERASPPRASTPAQARLAPAAEAPSAVAAPAPLVTAPAPPPAAVPAGAALDDLLAIVLAEREALAAERAELAAERREVAAERAAIRAEREELRAERATLFDRASAAEAEVARLRAAERAATPPAPAPAGYATLRRLFDARGLRGDDEHGAALAGFAAAHRVRELLDLVGVPDPEAVEALLADRLVLVGPGEEPPAGLVPVLVAADRSEAPEAPAVRTAVSRLVTVLLVNGQRRLCVIGGPGALHRVLREAIDPRIELRLYPNPGDGGLPDVPAGSVVALWGAASAERRLVEAFPRAARVGGRDLPRFCQAVVEKIEGG